MPPCVQWSSRPAGLLTSCSSSCDGRLLVCASDPQNSVHIMDASSGQTLHHVSGTTDSSHTVCISNTVSYKGAFVFSTRSSPLHHHTLSVRPSQPASGHGVCRPQHQTVGPAGSENHRVHRQVTNTPGHFIKHSSLSKCLILFSSGCFLSLPLSNHSNVVSDCCFSTSAHFLCTASWDKSLKLWDLQEGGFRSHGGTKLQRGHEGSVSSCSLSADGETSEQGSNRDPSFCLKDSEVTSLKFRVLFRGFSSIEVIYNIIKIQNILC